MKNNTSNATVQVNNEDQKKQNIQNQLTEHANNMVNHKKLISFQKLLYLLTKIQIEYYMKKIQIQKDH